MIGFKNGGLFEQVWKYRAMSIYLRKYAETALNCIQRQEIAKRRNTDISVEVGANNR